MDALQQDLTGPQYAATRALYTGEGVMTAADWDAAEAAAARPPPTTEAGAEREAEFVEQSLAGMAWEMEARAVELSNVQSSVEQALQATAADARAARRPIIAALAAGPVSGEGRGADSNVAKLQREAVHRLVSGQLIYHDIMEQLGGEAAEEGGSSSAVMRRAQEGEEDSRPRFADYIRSLERELDASVFGVPPPLGRRKRRPSAGGEVARGDTPAPVSPKSAYLFNDTDDDAAAVIGGVPLGELLDIRSLPVPSTSDSDGEHDVLKLHDYYAEKIEQRVENALASEYTSTMASLAAAAGVGEEGDAPLGGAGAPADSAVSDWDDPAYSDHAPEYIAAEQAAVGASTTEPVEETSSTLPFPVEGAPSAPRRPADPLYLEEVAAEAAAPPLTGLARRRRSGKPTGADSLMPRPPSLAPSLDEEGAVADPAAISRAAPPGAAVAVVTTGGDEAQAVLTWLRRVDGALGTLPPTPPSTPAPPAVSTSDPSDTLVASLVSRIMSDMATVAGGGVVGGLGGRLGAFGTLDPHGPSPPAPGQDAAFEAEWAADAPPVSPPGGDTAPLSLFAASDNGGDPRARVPNLVRDTPEARAATAAAASVWADRPPVSSVELAATMRTAFAARVMSTMLQLRRTTPSVPVPLRGGLGLLGSARAPRDKSRAGGVVIAPPADAVRLGRLIVACTESLGQYRKRRAQSFKPGFMASLLALDAIRSGSVPPPQPTQGVAAGLAAARHAARGASSLAALSTSAPPGSPGEGALSALASLSSRVVGGAAWLPKDGTGYPDDTRARKAALLSEMHAIFSNELRRQGLTPDVVTLNTYLSGLCAAGRVDAAYAFLNTEYAARNLSPDARTFRSLIRLHTVARRGPGELSKAEAVLATAKSLRVAPDADCYGLLVHGLAREYRIKDAIALIGEARAAGLPPPSEHYAFLLRERCKALGIRHPAVPDHPVAWQFTPKVMAMRRNNQTVTHKLADQALRVKRGNRGWRT